MPRRPEREDDRNRYILDHVTYPPMQERCYAFPFDPAKKWALDEMRLTLFHNGDESAASLQMLGPQGERAWQFMEGCWADFLREFPKRNVKEMQHLHTDD